MPMKTLALIGLACTLSPFTAFPAERAGWPAFQGPASPALSAVALPLEWSESANVAWKAPLPGYGQSSPVVWDAVAYVTAISGDDKERCHVSALSIDSGELLWTESFDAARKEKNTEYVSKAAPSPVADERGVVALFESGDLLACTPSGEVRWRRNLVAEFGDIASRHGLASSLVQSGDRVFVWIERETDPYLLAVDKSNGEIVWKSSGLGATSWSSPVLVPIDGVPQLILSGSGFLAGYDPASGTRLWTLDGLSGNTIPTPQPAGPNRLLIGATVGRGEGEASSGAKSNGLVEITRRPDGNGYAARYVWRAEKATSSFGSPIVHRGLAYIVNRVGVLFCVDLETGEEYYAQRLAGSVWATQVAVEDRIYIAGRSGETTVIEAGKEFRKLAENRLWKLDPPSPTASVEGAGPTATGGPVQYAMAILADRLLIRVGDAVYCVRGE